MEDQISANPHQPLVWTEDQGWFDQWGVAKRVRISSDQLYGIARFLAWGGTWHNHYMLTGGSNFGLQAGGDVVTGYAPDTVIDSYLLRHQPRFDSYAKFYGVVAAAASGILGVASHPKAQVLPSNASSSSSSAGYTASLDACTDTDPAHVGKLDPSQQWDVVTARTYAGELAVASQAQLRNRGSGLCMDASGSGGQAAAAVAAVAAVAAPALIKCSAGAAVPALEWVVDAHTGSIVDGMTGHVASVITASCLSPKAKGEQCHRCLDANVASNVLGLWDCKHGQPSDQDSNQWFHTSNGDQGGIRANRSGLCLTAVPGDSTSRVELHQYADGITFVSNTDSELWLAVKPFAGAASGGREAGGSAGKNADWELVLMPHSVVIVNSSTVPPTVLFDTMRDASSSPGGGSASAGASASASDPSTSSATQSAAAAVDGFPAELSAGGAVGGDSDIGGATGLEWEYYLEEPGVGASSEGPVEGLLEQLILTKNDVDYLWYSTDIPSGASPTDEVEAHGRESSVLHTFVNVTSGRIHILSAAMGMANGGMEPTSGKGIDGTKGVKFGKQDITKQKWTHTWMMPGEEKRIFDPTSTDAVAWRPVASANATVATVPLAWFRASFDLPASTSFPSSSASPSVAAAPAQLAYALNLTTMWKGQAYVNGFHLGRYWMEAGECNGKCAPPVKNGHCYMHWKDCDMPTQTLYHIPTPLLKPTGNLVVIFDENGIAPTGAPSAAARDLAQVAVVALTDHPEHY